MICRNRIWEELKQAKANIICIQKYTDKRRGYNRAYNGFVAITASAGALGTLLNDKVPFFASMLIGFVSIIKSVLPNFVQGESELSSLDVLADFYNKYMNSLENIWYRFDHDIIDEKQAMDEFFKLKETECDKMSQMNRLVRNISTRFQRKIDEQAKEYINRVYYEK
ncbi:hypothetical protein [Phocaeicola fibrisolvens]|uniref:hypothetical protein n=1 Tax=Phocaeicola fibrisolvens TaxID=2981793 RepID=UPI0011DD53FA|nr:hypothetical protein [Phocaeicola fibrisolvens]MCU6777317.1 hypothetical protein [Phocaeicola fibrisolvens]